MGTTAAVAALGYAKDGGGAILLALLLLWLGNLGYTLLNVRALGRAERCRKEAAELEREHETRFGPSTPEGQEGLPGSDVGEPDALPEHIQAEHRVDLLYWVLENRK